MTADCKEYICPGETHAISRSVHLARMAAYYPKCRECPLRVETGQLAPHYSTEERSRQQAAGQNTFTNEGVRGRYLNDLDRSGVLSITAAFASLLWDETSNGTERGDSPAHAHRPRVVVGYDQRPCSPDLVAGVTAALRRMGCSILDIGPATPQLLARSVIDSAATGGLLVTGAGCDPSWTGLDFLGPNARPISRSVAGEREPLCLQMIETRMQSPINRPTRTAGSHRTLQPWDRYEQDIAEAYHALRPLHVVVGVATPLLDRIVRALFSRLPCELTVVPLPIRARRLTDSDDADVSRVAVSVRENGGDLGFVTDDCGQCCCVVDETGRLVLPRELTPLLADVVAQPGTAFELVLGEQLPGDCLDALENRLGTVHHSSERRADYFRAMQTSDCVFGAESTGRYWFRREMPTCDAFLTLAATLSALSRSDARLTDVIAGNVVIR